MRIATGIFISDHSFLENNYRVEQDEATWRLISTCKSKICNTTFAKAEE